MLFLLGFSFVVLTAGVGTSAAQEVVPDLTGSWALLQVLSEYWEVPLLGERIRRIVQIARVRIEQSGPELTLWADEVCSMTFDLGTPLVQVSVSPEFVRGLRVGPLPGRLARVGEGFKLVIPGHTVLNGVRLSRPDEPLPTSADDPRVLDADGDGKPGFTVRVRILGLIPGESYVVQRLYQEYEGWVIGPDLLRGRIEWQDEQVTIGASAGFFLISGKGRPSPDLAFFVMRRIRENEPCSDLIRIFADDLQW